MLSLYQRAWTCTTEHYVALQSSILYCRIESCTTEHDVVLRSTALYYRIGFVLCTTEYKCCCTTEYVLILQVTICYCRIRSCTTDYGLALQVTVSYYIMRSCTTEYEHDYLGITTKLLCNRSGNVFFIKTAKHFTSRAERYKIISFLEVNASMLFSHASTRDIPRETSWTMYKSLATI